MCCYFWNARYEGDLWANKGEHITIVSLILSRSFLLIILLQLHSLCSFVSRLFPQVFFVNVLF
jgi:hypothetical protein